ncbi:Membrane fusion protein (MFP) family protein (modular protein) [Azospirillaceae bacterium]
MKKSPKTAAQKDADQKSAASTPEVRTPEVQTSEVQTSNAPASDSPASSAPTLPPLKEAGAQGANALIHNLNQTIHRAFLRKDKNKFLKASDIQTPATAFNSLDARHTVEVVNRDIGTIETVDEHARGIILCGVGILFMFFGVLGGWSAFAPLEGATMAMGQVKIEGSRKVVQHPDGGVVKDVFVREGQQVEADQVLIILEDTVARAGYNTVINQYYALLAQEARLLAESRKEQTITFPRELLEATSTAASDALKGQAEMFQVRTSILSNQMEVMNKRVAELQEHSRGIQAQIRAIAAQRQSVQNELSGLLPLYEKGLVAKTRVLDLERSKQKMEGEEHQLASDIAREQQTIAQTRQQILQIQYDRYGQVSTDLRETQNRISDTVQRLEAALDVLRRIEIRAPVSGNILSLTVFTKGAVIGKGEKLMEIVPDQKKLIIEASLRVDDVSFVHPGMGAEVRFSGLRQRDMPIIRGTVTMVSADRIVDMRAGSAYYLVEAKINDDDSAVMKEKQIDIYPGMSAILMIPTGKRTALDYLISPIMDSIAVSFRER